MPRSRRVTALLAVTVAIAASSFAAVPATALPVGMPFDQSGEVTAWGNNAYNQSEVPPGLTGVTAIAGGRYYSLALKSDGTVVDWGYGGGTQYAAPAGLSDVIGISTRGYHSMALKSDGTVVDWGDDDGDVVTVPDGLPSFTAVSAGYAHSLGLTSDGSVLAWGYNSSGQTNVPAGLTGVTAISAGAYYSMALKSDGTVVAWGYGGQGVTNVPAGLTGVTAISAGDSHALALKSDGTVVAWGYGDSGQATVPTGLTGVTAIAAGAEQSVALKSDGTVVVWGGGLNYPNTPPTGLTGVFAIAAGSYHTLALRAEATSPSFTDQSSPEFVQAGESVNYTFAASGFPAPTFSVSAGELPPGLSLSESGVLSGTSTVTGTYEFAVTASNGQSPNAVSDWQSMQVTPGEVDAVSVAPQAGGSTTYTATAGAPLPFTSHAVDQWGNPSIGHTAVITTDNASGINPDFVSGGTVTFFNAGVHLVTTTIGGVSTTVSVTTLPGAPVSTELASSSLQVPLGGSINLSMSGLDAYGNVIDLTDQAVFTSDWAVDVISGSTITFPHASPHVITGRVGSLTSTTTIEVVEPTVAASTAAAGSLSALAFTGISPLPAVFGGAGALLVGLLVSLFTWSRRRNRTGNRASIR